MLRYKIKSAALKGRFETADEKSARKKLAEVRKQDPQARILTIPAAR